MAKKTKDETTNDEVTQASVATAEAQIPVDETGKPNPTGYYTQPLSGEQQREALVGEAHAHLDAANAVVKQLTALHGERYHRVLNKLHETLGALAQ